MLLGLYQSSIGLVQFLVSDSNQNSLSWEKGSMYYASAISTKGERWRLFAKLLNLEVMSPHKFWVTSVLSEHSDGAAQGGRLHGA